MYVIRVAFWLGSGLILAGIITSIVQRLLFGKRVRRRRFSWWMTAVLLTVIALAIAAIKACTFDFDYGGIVYLIAFAVLPAELMIWGVAITVRVIARFIEGRPARVE